jgi:hypothetical protein
MPQTPLNEHSEARACVAVVVALWRLWSESFQMPVSVCVPVLQF